MEHNTDRIGDLEVKDDGPDQTQGQLGVPICDVVVSDVHQLDLGETRERKKPNPKTEIMQRMDDVRSLLVPGDQLWMMRRGRTHKSYAHVAIISENNQFIHAKAPNMDLMIQSKATICEEDLSSVDNLQLCFVVRPPTIEGLDPLVYLKRAQACLNIRFDYDASVDNCETFCNGIHGEWEQNFQSPDGKAQNTVDNYTKLSKWFKSADKPLKDQMRKRISNEKLILPNEKF